MREDAPAGPSLNLYSKALGIRPRGLPCNRSYAVFLPFYTSGSTFRLSHLPAIAIARLTAAVCHTWERFATRHLAIIADAALSCRLCLIACNSRQFDDRESGCD